MQSAEVEAVMVGTPAALSAADRAAITEALPAISKTGSWITACSACLEGDLELLGAPDLAHCRDCGLVDGAASLFRGMLA